MAKWASIGNDMQNVSTLPQLSPQASFFWAGAAVDQAKCSNSFTDQYTV